MNFTVNELCKSATALRKGINNTPSKSVEANLNKLINNVLQPIRDVYGKPIIVDSGYRCPRLNDLVKGSKTSQHLIGEAADIRSTSDSIKDNKELFDVIKTLIKEKKIEVGQLINEYNYNWVHVSLPNKKHKNEILAIK